MAYPYSNRYPAHYGYGAQQLPDRYQPPQQQMSGLPPQLLQQLAYLLASRSEQEPDAQAPFQEPSQNPYLSQMNRPTLPGLSPLGRFNDMALRQSAALATNLQDGQEAVAGSLAQSNERQRIVDSITHPAPMAPYSISPTMTPTGAPSAVLNSRYGTGSVSFAPSGTQVHGTFGADNLPFGEIGGPNEAQPIAGDPEQTTFQQQMIMDSVAKALGKKKK